MKRKIFKAMALTLTMATVMASFTACGKKPEVEETLPVEVEVVSENDGKETEYTPSTMTEEGATAPVFTGRVFINGYIPEFLSHGATFGSLPQESNYFNYLYVNWVDDSWNNKAVAEDSTFYKDIFTALDAGLYERMTGTIGDYTAVETEMCKVYKGITPVENTINEDVVNIAIADIAGFNGCGFTNESSVQDEVCLGLVLDTAAIFAQDDTFKDLPYTTVEIGNGEVLYKPATGHDINYALAVALGLDAENASEALQAEGYSAFDDSVTSVALITYDKIMVNNARVYAAKKFGKEQPADNGSQPTQPTDNGNNQPTDNGNNQPTDNGNNQPTDNGNNQPTDNGGLIGKHVFINGVEYIVGNVYNGVVCDDPAYYNHPESAIMSLDALMNNIFGADGLNYDDTWAQDYDTRDTRADKYFGGSSNVE